MADKPEVTASPPVTKPDLDEHGRAPGENVPRPPEPKVKGDVLSVEDITKRVAEARAKQLALPPPPLRPGDWNGALQAITNLQARIAQLEGKK